MHRVEKLEMASGGESFDQRLWSSLDTDKYKSIAISMPVYKKLKELAEQKYDAPVSMAKICEMLINKDFEKYNEHRS